MRTLLLLATLLIATPAHAYYFTMENTGEYSGIHHLTITLLHAPYEYDPAFMLTLTETELGFTPIAPGATFTSGTLDTQGWFPVVLYGIGIEGGTYTYKNTCCTFTGSWPEGGYGFTLTWRNGSPPSSVPEPATLWMLLMGAVGIFAMMWLRPVGGSKAVA
jgi:hypothetical protein